MREAGASEKNCRPELVRETEEKLKIKSVGDWYRVSYDQLSELGVLKLNKMFLRLKNVITGDSVGLKGEKFKKPSNFKPGNSTLFACIRAHIYRNSI